MEDRLVERYFSFSLLKIKPILVPLFSNIQCKEFFLQFIKIAFIKHLQQKHLIFGVNSHHEE